MQQADLVLLNGASYESWLQNVSLPSSRLVVTSDNFKDRYIYADEVTTHTHGAGGAHAHESLAFTTWLDLSLAKLQAETIYKAFSRKRPGAEKQFSENFMGLASELESLHKQIKELVSIAPNRALLGSHPVYDYLSAGYGLNIKSVHWETDEVPSLSQWNELKQILVEHQVSVMLWEGKPVPESIDKLKAMGVVSVTFDPCGNKPVSGDFVSVMESNVNALKDVYNQLNN